METVLLGEVPWFDQNLAHEFFTIKGILSLVATLSILGHMTATWSRVETWGRRLRYFALLYVSALMTFASVEQVSEAEFVDYRHLGAMLGAVIILVAMGVSMREDVRARSTR